MAKAKRGRVGRTEPPKLDDGTTQAGSKQGNDLPRQEAQKPAKDKKKQPAGVKMVTIRVPVGEFVSDTGYQVSPDNPPTAFGYRRLTRRQGIALARLRLGMIAKQQKLDDGQQPVDNKEQTLSRILELVASQLDCVRM
jgi:hypothetical protein